MKKQLLLLHACQVSGNEIPLKQPWGKTPEMDPCLENLISLKFHSFEWITSDMKNSNYSHLLNAIVGFWQFPNPVNLTATDVDSTPG